MEAWAAGGLTLQGEQQLLGRVQALEEIAEKRLEDVQAFYFGPDGPKRERE